MQKYEAVRFEQDNLILDVNVSPNEEKLIEKKQSAFFAHSAF